METVIPIKINFCTKWASNYGLIRDDPLGSDFVRHESICWGGKEEDICCLGVWMVNSPISSGNNLINDTVKWYLESTPQKVCRSNLVVASLSF